MSDILDNKNIQRQRDPSDALGLLSTQFEQVMFDAKVWNDDHDDREITGVVLAGMGGSALAALIAKSALNAELSIPFDIVRGYDLPAHVTRNTLVIASSYSGNTEETLSALEQAEKKGAQLAILTSGGQLVDIATNYNIAHVALPGGVQPRMATLYNLKALYAILAAFGIIAPSKLIELEELSGWLGRESAKWGADSPIEDNYAKQLAHEAVGKTPVFYGGPLTAPLAYKWKISWNETAKNLAFWNEYPEFNHNEFMGWTSHPVEKPFVIFDLVSQLEHPQVLRRFAISDKLLSGQRPHAQTIELKGDTKIAQLLWGAILSDFASVYTAILNNVDPTPVVLIEKLKKELSS
ncbi:bifunctional phosphoglucose/phosphomannose isomerase [Candidatus Saccharibacteria bacterium]|nr:bifunctional phosphoglucose/phosphomannose isomerase [Candidatus Saccharibacteria bacterium]